MKRIILISLAAIFIALLSITAWNWRFINRAATYPADKPITSVEWYDAMDVVEGNLQRPLPSLAVQNSQLDRSQIAKAVRFAREQNSSALVAAWGDSIMIEEYWQGSDPSSYTNSMSMAKSILVTLLGIAVQNGYIKSIKEPVSAYIPEWQNDERSLITIEHLLRMTSGLRIYDDQGDPFSDLVQLYLGLDAAETAVAVTAAKSPGQIFEYNNANSQVLGVILERATGMDYADFMSEHLWKPLGAGNAKQWLDVPDGTAKTFCCMFARARDWVRLGQMLARGGSYNGQQILSEEWIAEMISPGIETDYGLHIWLGFTAIGRRKDHRSEPFVAKDMYWMDGADMQRVYIIPSYQLVIVRVGERASAWDDAIIPNALVRAVKKAEKK